MTTAMSLRLPEKLSKALDELAEKAERPKSYLVRKVLEEYVAEHLGTGKGQKEVQDRDTDPYRGKIGHSLDRFFGTWTEKEAKQFMKSIEIFEKIDEKHWK